MEGLSSHSDIRDRAWYAVYTIVRHEKKVNEALMGKETVTYLPLAETLSRWKDRRKKVRIPLFPGYLFVNIDPKERRDVLSTRGVVSILGVNGAPVPIPDEQIDGLKKLLSSDYKYDPYPYFAEGREVVVVRGPLEGVRGRISERRGEFRLILSVDLLRRGVSVEVDVRDVEPA